MRPRRRTAFAAASAFVLLASACARDEADPAHVEIEVDVAATLALGATVDDVAGTIALDLTLPEGAPEREVILTSIGIGSHALQAGEVSGLDRFPRTLAGGDEVHVELQIDVQGFTDVADLLATSAASCTRTASIPVEVWVTDAQQAARYVSTIATDEATVMTPPPPPAGIAVASARDLSTVRLVAADPRTDDELLVASGTEVARVAADGRPRRVSHPAGVENVIGVARGGGVDAIAAHGDLDGLPCDPSPMDDPAGVLVARLDGDGQIAWCAPIADAFIDLLVTDEGTIAALTTPSETWATSRMSLFPLEGDATDSEVEVPPFGVALGGSDGGAVVVGGTDPTGRGRLAIVRSDGARLIDVPESVLRVLARRDGTVGVVTSDAYGFDPKWQILDVESGQLRVVAPAPQVTDAFVELPSGAFVAFTQDAAGALVATLLGDAGWADAIACSGQAVRVVNGARGESTVAIDAADAVLAGEPLVEPGAMRTIVFELDDVR